MRNLYAEEDALETDDTFHQGQGSLNFEGASSVGSIDPTFEGEDDSDGPSRTNEDGEIVLGRE